MFKALTRLAAFLLAILLLSASACMGEADIQASAPHTIGMKACPYLYCYKKEDTVHTGEMNLYYVDGGDVPYIALTEFIPVLTEFYNIILNSDPENQVSFEIRTDGTNDADRAFLVTRTDNSSTLIIQPGDDTMIFTNYNSFDQKPGSSALVSFISIPDLTESSNLSSYVEALIRAQRNGESTAELQEKMSGLNKVKDPAEDHSFFVATNRVFNRRGAPLTMDLGDYGIDLLCQDGECYIPLQTVNDIFFGTHYVYMVFNGEKIIADVYHGTLMDQAYEADPADMSEEFALFNFHELCFLMDHFYGLKQEHRIDSFFDFFAGDTAKLSQISGTDSISFDSAMTEVLTRYLDDSHSALVRYSWRSGQQGSTEFLGTMSNIGYSAALLSQVGARLGDARRAAYPDGVPGYEEIGDTAFITFDNFTVNRPINMYYELENPDDPQDTIELIMYANRQIRREGSPVRNIVMDLSMNGGGDSDAALAAACWFTGEARIALLDMMTGAETIASYRTDLNVNGIALSDPEDAALKYDSGDTVSGQYNLFCIISPASFSCGNLVPSIFDQAGRITLIGQRSGGGSNAVLPVSTASGLLFQISGPLQITTFKNGSLYGVDTGVEPHVRLNYYDSFYDREGLVEMIHHLK